MEDQPGALGLVVNVMVLWTTLYMDRALSQLQALGAAIYVAEAPGDPA
jgi:TnpA family transposase